METQFIGGYDEVPRWNRDCLWDHKQKSKCDEIPMRERDELWKRNSFGDDDEIPMWDRDKYGKAIYMVTTMEFQRGIKTNVEMQ